MVVTNLGDLVSGDDERGEEIEDSIHKEAQEHIEKDSAIDVGC